MCRKVTARRGGFRAALETEQHLARHDEGGRFEGTHEEGRTHSPRDASAVAGDEPRPPFIDRIQPELPHPFEAVGLAAEHQRAEWLNGFDWKPGTSTYRNNVTDPELLEFRQHSLRAWGVQEAKQAVEPVVAVQPAASIPHLDEEGPDVSRRRVNGDSQRRCVVRNCNLWVPNHRPLDLRVGRAPASKPSSDRKPIDQAEANQHGERHEFFSHNVPCPRLLQISC